MISGSTKTGELHRSWRRAHQASLSEDMLASLQRCKHEGVVQVGPGANDDLQEAGSDHCWTFEKIVFVFFPHIHGSPYRVQGGVINHLPPVACHLQMCMRKLAALQPQRSYITEQLGYLYRGEVELLCHFGCRFCAPVRDGADLHPSNGLQLGDMMQLRVAASACKLQAHIERKETSPDAGENEMPLQPVLARHLCALSPRNDAPFPKERDYTYDAHSDDIGCGCCSFCRRHALCVCTQIKQDQLCDIIPCCFSLSMP